MTYSLTWLPHVLEASGLKVAETPGWRTRGRAEMGTVKGVMCHHTATRRGGNMPTLQLLIDGRSNLAGPLAQLGLGRDGTFYVVAAGRANHAGRGLWEGLTTGNSSFIGIEAENSGDAAEAWPSVQMEAYQRGVAAILARIGVNAKMCCGHKEYALPTGRKVDPDLDMAGFRNAVSAYLAGKGSPPPIPAQIDDLKPTLRRGSRGAFVGEVQKLLGIEANGIFGASTEAALRAAQRRAGVVPDGILGPKSWTALLTMATSVAGASPAAPAATPFVVVPAPDVLNVMPVADDGDHQPHMDGLHAISPSGQRFASKWRTGLMSIGETGVGAWLKNLSKTPSSMTSATARVLKAMCVNEGGLEAINTYDGCHMSFGVFQWTAGLDDQPGELPLLLASLKKIDEAAFGECFGRYDLDVTVQGSTGFFILAGVELRTPEQKDALRDIVWAYRFWRAGHHPLMRACQLALAAERINSFMTVPTAGLPLKEWLTSELGVALLLDEHVNRPSHVPSTLENAIDAIGTRGSAPSDWTTIDESRLILAYLQARATTSMTDSAIRAQKIEEFVRSRELSDARGSFP